MTQEPIGTSEGADERPALRGSLLKAAFLLGLLAVYVSVLDVHGMPLDLFRLQDRIVVVVAIALFVGAAFLLRRLPSVSLDLDVPRPVVVLAAVAVILLLVAGTYWLMGNHAFTRDEQMAVFDAAIYRSGKLAAPLSPEWRPYAVAMEPFFLLTLPGNAGWVSAYMPGNAVLRALFSLAADPAWLNPLLASLAAVLLLVNARRLFPGDKSALTVTLLVFLSSAQMLVMAMTPFAMTAHLFFNLLWLTFFLRGGRQGHAAAGLVGFFATGIHQVVFHPLFALPFLEHLRRKGEWRTSLFYLGCYGAAGLFWISYPHLVANSLGVRPQAGGPGAASFLADRALPLLLNRDPLTLPLMAFNLLRFAAWQNLALVPLFLLALPVARRGEGIAFPLYLGVLLTLAAMFVLMPYQAIGWGYRYVHGLLGSFALLAGYGWQRIRDERGSGMFFASATAMSILFCLPFLAWRTHEFVTPSARLDRVIAGVHADMAIIDTDDFGASMDLVRNDPFLRHHPLRLSSAHLKRGDIGILCRRGSIAFVSAATQESMGLTRDDAVESQHFEELRGAAKTAGCPVAGS